MRRINVFKMFAVILVSIFTLGLSQVAFGQMTRQEKLDIEKKSRVKKKAGNPAMHKDYKSNNKVSTVKEVVNKDKNLLMEKPVNGKTDANSKSKKVEGAQKTVFDPEKKKTSKENSKKIKKPKVKKE